MPTCIGVSYNVHMSTLKTNKPGKRIAILLQQGQKIFHLKDLANLWLINNPNTLRTTLKRYCRQGLLYRIFRGMYSVITPDKLDPAILGSKAIHRYCYLSTETILYQTGIIGQKINYYTFISEKSIKFSVGNNNFISRRLNTRYLYNNIGVYLENGIKKATPERAVADLLYFNPKYHFDQKINWQKIRHLQKAIGYPLTPNRYDSPKNR